MSEPHSRPAERDEAPPSHGQRRADLPGPERMRDAVADYVREVHEAYVRGARLLSPAVQARLPLFAPEPLSVAAIGTRYLHLVATREPLGAGARGEIAAVEGTAGPLRWRLQFYDPVVVPALGLLDERDGPAFEEARAAIGLRTHVYHLSLRPPADLAAHHAGHTGAGLVGAHAAAAREFEAIGRAVPADLVGLAAEFEGALIGGLPRAAGLIATRLAPDDPAVATAAGTAADGPADQDGLRKAVLVAVRARARS